MKKFFASAFLAATVFCGCAPLYENPEHTLNLSEDKTDGTCVRGETVVVALKANPTTGYAWRAKSECSPALKFVRENYCAENPKLCGAGGISEFVYIADAVGDAELRFEYVRAWEKNPAAKTAVFNISVK